MGVGVELLHDELVDAAQGQAGDLGAFGDVLGDAPGDVGEVNLATGGVDVPDVQPVVQVAPGDPPAASVVRR